MEDLSGDSEDSDVRRDHPPLGGKNSFRIFEINKYSAFCGSLGSMLVTRTARRTSARGKAR